MLKEDFSFQNNFPHLVECKSAVKPFCTTIISLLSSASNSNINPIKTFSFCFTTYTTLHWFILLYKNYLKSVDGFSAISAHRQINWKSEAVCIISTYSLTLIDLKSFTLVERYHKDRNAKNIWNTCMLCNSKMLTIKSQYVIKC